MAIIDGSVPVRKGEPGMFVRAPVDGLIVKTLTLLEPPFVTYNNCPDGSTATEVGPVPAENGEPGIGVKAPDELLMVNAETLFEPWFATNTNLPVGSIVIESGSVPTG
jgi:hypothetical protein